MRVWMRYLVVRRSPEPPDDGLGDDRPRQSEVAKRLRGFRRPPCRGRRGPEGKRRANERADYHVAVVARLTAHKVPNGGGKLAQRRRRSIGEVRSRCRERAVTLLGRRRHRCCPADR